MTVEGFDGSGVQVTENNKEKFFLFSEISSKREGLGVRRGLDGQVIF